MQRAKLFGALFAYVNNIQITWKTIHLSVFCRKNSPSTDQRIAEGNYTECVGKKRFNGRVLPTGFGKSMCYVPPFCFWTREFQDGPVVKTLKSRHKGPVEDGVTTINMGPFCHKTGLSWLMTCQYLWCVKDICGIICCIFTWMLIVYAEYVVIFVMLIHNPYTTWSLINGIIFQFFAFLATSSHMKAMWSDPGSVPKGNATREHILRMGLRAGQVVFKCPKCVCIKPERAHHCSVCQRCIKKMDHHCPWVNNCIGENNQKYFVLFTMYICIISFHSLYMAIYHFITCVGKEWKICTGFSPPATTVFLIFLIFEGLLFGIFTAIMCGTQLSAICSDETGIENLKSDNKPWEKQSYWLSLKSVFGHPFDWRWFSPFSVPKFTNSGSYHCV